MSENRDVLVELVTRPWDGDEQERAEVADAVRARLEENGAPDAEVAQAVALLERADQRGAVRHWKTVLYVLVGVVVVLGAVQGVRMRAALPMLTDMGPMQMDEPAPKVQRPERFLEAELLLLYGSEGADSEADKWRPLWKSQPQNPMYFAEYVGAVFQDKRTVPDEIMEKAAEVDPDNGWYAGLKAGSLFKDNVERVKQTNKDRDELKAGEYTVKDEEDFRQGLALLYEMARKPKYDSYQEEIMRERLTVMGRPEDWFGFVLQLAYLAGDSSPGLISTRFFSHALAVEAGRCAEKGDRDGCLRVFATWEAMMKHLLNDGHTMVDLLVAKVVMTEPAVNFRDAARKLGLENEAKRFEELARWRQEEWNRRNGPNRVRTASAEEMMVERKASIMASLTLPLLGRQVRKPPVLTEDDLKPSRLFEHAFLLRLLVGAGSVVLLFGAGAAALRLACTSKSNLVLSRRLDGMVTARDWLLILFVGGVLPVLLYGCLTYLTPLSARDWSFRMGAMYHFPLQFAVVVILIPVLACALASWICDRRLGLLCGKSKSPKWRRVMAVSALFALPVCGSFILFAYIVGVGSLLMLSVLWVAAGLSAVPLLWMLVRVLKPAFGKKDPTPRTACLVRLALPGVSAGILALGAAAPLLQWEEGHWLAKDRLMVVTPEAPAMTRYEWDVTQVLRGELRERLGTDD